MAEGQALPTELPGASCANCGKPLSLCVCAALEPISNRIFTLILQHPQEQDRELGTAFIAHLQLRRSRLVVGLSWPSLGAALGAPADPRKWGVLHLGAAREGAGDKRRPITALSRRGEPLPDQAAALAAIEGIILLDGSWSQAKALWWRNPWLLKAHRLVLDPSAPSLYGRLRREPRRESVATIEAAALALAALEGDATLPVRVLRPFALLLERYQATRPSGRQPTARRAAEAVAKPRRGH
jgi:DTW domain-containing protein